MKILVLVPHILSPYSTTPWPLLLSHTTIWPTFQSINLFLPPSSCNIHIHLQCWPIIISQPQQFTIILHAQHRIWQSLVCSIQLNKHSGRLFLHGRWTKIRVISKSLASVCFLYLVDVCVVWTQRKELIEIGWIIFTTNNFGGSAGNTIDKHTRPLLFNGKWKREQWIETGLAWT